MSTHAPRDETPVEEIEEAVRPSRAYAMTYPWARIALGATARVLAPRNRVSGIENVPRRGGVILASNHISDSDPPFILNASPRALWFMAKRELFDMTVLGLDFGPIIRFCQAFPVDPGGADRAALRRAESLLEADQAVVIFPEGRCSKDGELQEITSGTVMLALRAAAPIVPVGLWGTHHVMPYAQTVPRPSLSRVRVHFGAPLDFNTLRDLPKREQREAATQQLENAMRQARDVARGETIV